MSECSNRSSAGANGFGTMQSDKLANYDPCELGLKIKEDDVLPLVPGAFEFHAKMALLGDVSLLGVHVGGKSVGTTVLDPGYLGFAIPASWTGDYYINGEPADPNSLFMGADTSCCHIRAGRRHTLGVVLPRTAFIETVAALRGVEPEAMTAADRILTQTPAAAGELRRRIAGIIEANCANNAPPNPPWEMAHEVFGMMLDAYLTARPGTSPKGHLIRNRERIVRQAEEHFMAAEGKPVSLADICAAAGVSKSTLYNAFHHVCGQSPLGYFRKRRMGRARISLLNSSPQRGAVKVAALTAGFTELGRFSVEYRHLFGESPSTTLKSPQG